MLKAEDRVPRLFTSLWLSPHCLPGTQLLQSVDRQNEEEGARRGQLGAQGSLFSSALAEEGWRIRPGPREGNRHGGRAGLDREGRAEYGSRDHKVSYHNVTTASVRNEAGIIQHFSCFEGFCTSLGW